MKDVERITIRQERLKELRTKAAKIAREVEKYSKGGASGNQNCMLCTWAMELQCRGRDVLPRPVYSPRDPIFKLQGYEIVKGGVKIALRDEQQLRDTIEKAGPGSRFYTHVNWRKSSSGHEFLLCNVEGQIFVVDAQRGSVSSLDNKEIHSKYLNINWTNSYMVRLDNRPVNESVWHYNDGSYLVQWDEAKDVAYLEGATESDGGFYHDGTWNSVVKVNGRNYRHRVECLIIKDNAVFIAKKGRGYALPGGSTEKNVSDEEQCIRECQEEAFITPCNLKKYGTYRTDYDAKNPAPKWMKELPVPYDGLLTDIYVGQFKDRYNGQVDAKDRSDSIARGDWMAIKDAMRILRPVHKDALRQYLRALDSKNETHDKSTVDPNYKPKGNKKLSSFKRINLTDRVLDRYQGDELLKDIMPSQAPFRNACLWLDGDKPVATVEVHQWNGHHIIDSVAVAKQYRGYGLGRQVVDYAVNELGGDMLGVYDDNYVARKLYEDYGFSYQKKEPSNPDEKDCSIMYLPSTKRKRG
jgi:ribosomal protein S18 acetylase RimI-like enzyme